MTIVTYNAASPFAATEQKNWYLENLTYRDLPRHHTDELITIDPKYNLRPYNLSYDRYGYKDYWWVFMTMNMNVIRDPIYDFVAGKQIYAPTKERLLSAMGVRV